MKNRNLWSSHFKVNIQALVSILALAFFMVFVYVSSYIPYKKVVGKQIDADAFGREMQVGARHFGYIQPKVVDGFSEEPIKDAVVVIPEMGQRFITSDDGLT